MSILIKNMKMSKEKALRIVLRPNGQVCVDCGCYWDEYEAVEIPTSHGRLVDINKVYEVLSEQYHHTTEIQHMALQEALLKVPTIVEREDK